MHYSKPRKWAGKVYWRLWGGTICKNTQGLKSTWEPISIFGAVFAHLATPLKNIFPQLGKISPFVADWWQMRLKIDTTVKKCKFHPHDEAIPGLGGSWRPHEVGPRWPAYVDKADGKKNGKIKRRGHRTLHSLRSPLCQGTSSCDRWRVMENQVNFYFHMIWTKLPRKRQNI